MRALGVHCTSQFAFLSVVDGGKVVEHGPARLAHAKSTSEDQALWETLSTFATALDEISPDRVCLLGPGTGNQQTHHALAPRIELETLLRMAAAQRNIPVDRLSRAAVLSRLGLPRGPFEGRIKPVIAEQGSYWAAGRMLAAAAGLAAGSD